MQRANLFLSDIPPHDMARDFVLLAEQLKVESDLKEKLEVRSAERGYSWSYTNIEVHCTVQCTEGWDPHTADIFLAQCISKGSWFADHWVLVWPHLRRWRRASLRMRPTGWRRR